MRPGALPSGLPPVSPYRIAHIHCSEALGSEPFTLQVAFMRFLVLPFSRVASGKKCSRFRATREKGARPFEGVSIIAHAGLTRGAAVPRRVATFPVPFTDTEHSEPGGAGVRGRALSGGSPRGARGAGAGPRGAEGSGFELLLGLQNGVNGVSAALFRALSLTCVAKTCSWGNLKAV